MINKITINQQNDLSPIQQQRSISEYPITIQKNKILLPEILFITSYPPRECGIATYSQDLIKALNNKFQKSFSLTVCALETETEKHIYPETVKYTLNTEDANSYIKLAKSINENKEIKTVLIQHEFGFYRDKNLEFIQFLNAINKPILIVFHTVLPNPNEELKQLVQEINKIASAFIVMTNSSAKLLVNDYSVKLDKISVIPHGTHLVEHTNKSVLKEKYNLVGKKVLSTFGLLSSGKSIETTLDALPLIVKDNPDVIFLIIGKTHPTIFKMEGEKYRNSLEAKIEKLQLQKNVQFVNQFLPLPELLEYLQLTDIYLFTSKDPNQAVSGTFAYAISCGCPIISTPIPHACEVLKEDTGIIIDFGNSKQLAKEALHLLKNETLRKNISSNGLHKMAPNAWENSAIAHATLFEKIAPNETVLKYKIPKTNLNHLKNLTTSFGMIQFSIINQPDINSGYTLDDNARALVSMCQHYELSKDENDLEYIKLYFNFIKYCLQPEGNFLNYIEENKNYAEQNNETNIDDSNGRAIWALGYLISNAAILPSELIKKAKKTIELALTNANEIHSTRAMAFIIKGVYYYNTETNSFQNTSLIRQLADRLVQMYRHEGKENWKWFESYLTYANSILPEALLCAYLATGKIVYREIAKNSFDFLLEKIFNPNQIKVISNKGWLNSNEAENREQIGGEQPIDVAYTILALNKFYEVFKEKQYFKKSEIAFNWFLGNNHLHQIIYNPCTGGCYDGLEENYINLNQGAESTVSYLMAKLTMEKLLKKQQKIRQLNIESLPQNIQTQFATA
jgi:glycosyltransferase involved in cell wall biosynthesis